MKSTAMLGSCQPRFIIVTPQERAPRVMFVTTVAQSLRFYRDQIRYLRRHGFMVSAVSTAGPDQVAIGRETGADMHAVPMSRSISPVADLVSVWRLARAMRRAAPDIVHAATPKAGLVGMTAAVWCRRQHRVYHILGLPYLTARGPKRALMLASERFTCRLATRVFCVSPSIRDIAIADRLCTPEKITVIGNGSVNGVDAEGRFDPGAYDSTQRTALRQELGIGMRQPVVGYVGRVVRDKGIDVLAAAWPDVARRFPDARLVIVGEFENQDPVSPETRSILRRHDIVVTGHVDNPAPYFAIFDIVTLPTFREGFGNVLIEAASMRIPTITTSVPGAIDAIVDGVTGTVVPPRDADALASAISRYLMDARIRTMHGTAGRDRVLARFTRERIWKETLQEYLAMLRKRRQLIDLRMHETEGAL